MISNFAGHHHSESSRHKMSQSHIGKKKPWAGKHLKDKNIIKKRIKTMIQNNTYSKIGSLGAQKRWEGHIPVVKDRELLIQKINHNKSIQLEKKRFRNQRYKAYKRNAEGSHTFQEWENLKKLYQFMCLCCKRIEPEIKLSEDHIIPLSMGGTDYIDNIQPLCVSCNVRKYTKILDYRSSDINYQIMN